MTQEQQIRKIIHCDMDAFYAAVEQRDDPKLKGRPVIIGGSPQSRGVVATTSYEARRFGVRSAMSCAEAYRRCPEGIFIPPQMKKYRSVSLAIHQLFAEVADVVEPLALDEAFLDVTTDRKNLAVPALLRRGSVSKFAINWALPHRQVSAPINSSPRSPVINANPMDRPSYRQTELPDFYIPLHYAVYRESAPRPNNVPRTTTFILSAIFESLPYRH